MVFHPVVSSSSTNSIILVILQCPGPEVELRPLDLLSNMLASWPWKLNSFRNFLQVVSDLPFIRPCCFLQVLSDLPFIHPCCFLQVVSNLPFNRPCCFLQVVSDLPFIHPCCFLQVVSNLPFNHQCCFLQVVSNLPFIQNLSMLFSAGCVQLAIHPIPCCFLQVVFDLPFIHSCCFLQVVSDLPFIHPSEVKVLNDLCRLGTLYRSFQQFIQDHGTGVNTKRTGWIWHVVDHFCNVHHCVLLNCKRLQHI